MKRFLDANIIAYAFYQNKNQERCQEIIFEGGMLDSLVLVEAFNIIEWQLDRQAAIRSIKSLLSSNIEIIDVDTTLIFESMKQSKSHPHLRFLDTVHYTCALLNGCSEIATFDKDFDGLAIKRVE